MIIRFDFPIYEDDFEELKEKFSKIESFRRISSYMLPTYLDVKIDTSNGLKMTLESILEYLLLGDRVLGYSNKEGIYILYQ